MGGLQFNLSVLMRKSLGRVSQEVAVEQVAASPRSDGGRWMVESVPEGT